MPMCRGSNTNLPVILVREDRLILLFIFLVTGMSYEATKRL